ncbi:hypothetical protein G3O08_16380 [Cryomorpha ignava]|uniref:Lipoprotein n=1 Tax=Cryomorpha ignava TaxID=101383 RepID=A0A7K3WU48_9FLAO|nr:hypothetical protein [Cryomorpha ignava]NEN25078.1 hypothetical protein [Cryomorpha ignava]
MKQKHFKILSLLGLVLLLAACGGRNENRKMVEASAIHEQILDKHDSIYSVLQEQEQRVEKKLGKLSANDPDRVAYESMMRSINRSYNLLASWMEGVADFPGSKHIHNSDSPHKHDPEKERTMKGMSDQEILDLQKAYKTRLDEVGLKIKELITTMDMYTKDEN